MGKRMKKNNSYNEDILILLKTRYGFTVDYIQKSIRGDRKGTIPDIIKKEYETLAKEASVALSKKVTSLDIAQAKPSD